MRPGRRSRLPAAGVAALLLLQACAGFVGAPATAESPPDESRFRRSLLLTDLDEPMELAVSPDLRVLVVECKGTAKLYDPPAGTAPRTRVLRIAHLTDVHVLPEKGAPEGLARCLHHLQSQEDPPEGIFNGGDTIMDALGADRARVRRQWEVWHNVIRAECSLPIEHCIGNHDVWGAGPTGDPLYGKKWTLEEMRLAHPYRSFDRAGWHFVVLDSVHPTPGGWYTARLDEAQFDWLVRDLEHTDPTTPVMVLSHIPILTVTSFLISELDRELAETGNWVVPGSWMHTDARRLAELFTVRGNVRLCASGHMHMVDRLDYRGVTYVCNGAVSGAWWDGTYHEHGAGYAVIDLFSDGTFTNTYLSYD